MSNAHARLPYAEAMRIAQQLETLLTPAVARLTIAGSLRRQRPDVGDIEMVIEPLALAADLMGGAPQPDIDVIRGIARGLGTLTKNGDRFIQISEVLGTGMTCDLWLAHAPANYYVQLAIRTGPARLGQWAVTRMHDFGLYCRDGRILTRGGEEWPVHSEADFFRAAGLRYLAPEKRDSPEAFKPRLHG